MDGVRIDDLRSDLVSKYLHGSPAQKPAQVDAKPQNTSEKRQADTNVWDNRLPPASFPPLHPLPAVLQEALMLDITKEPDSISTSTNIANSTIAKGDLAEALRRARADSAELTESNTTLRETEMARLQLLQHALQPVLADVPDHIDLFDAAIAPGERPRLFIDMIGFVEMDRDRRGYRFVQDTRHGRVLMAESSQIDIMVRNISDYIARRLLEREKALASDMTIEDAARIYLGHKPLKASIAETGKTTEVTEQLKTDAPERDLPEAQSLAAKNILPKRKPERTWAGFFGRSFLLLVEFLGSFALFAILIAASVYGYGLWMANR